MYVILQLQHSVGDVSNSTSSTVQSLTELVVFFFYLSTVHVYNFNILLLTNALLATVKKCFNLNFNILYFIWKIKVHLLANDINMINHKLYTRRTKCLSTHKTITSSHPAYKRQIFTTIWCKIKCYIGKI